MQGCADMRPIWNWLKKKGRIVHADDHLVGDRGQTCLLGTSQRKPQCG